MKTTIANFIVSKPIRYKKEETYRNAVRDLIEDLENLGFDVCIEEECDIAEDVEETFTCDGCGAVFDKPAYEEPQNIDDGDYCKECAKDSFEPTVKVEPQ